MNNIMEHKIRSETNMDWMANPWITTVTGRIQSLEISSLKLMPTLPATLLLQIMQSLKRDYIVGPENAFSYYQCVDLKLNPLIHSSRRLKDTLTQKRH